MTPKFSILASTRNEYRILALMLILLHLAVRGDVGGPVSRWLMLAHLGLFFIWQPLWNRQLSLKWSSASIFVLATFAFVTWLDWWLLIFWLLLLIGIVAGRVTIGRVDRVAYLGTLLFLFTELLIGAVPVMFGVEHGSKDSFAILSYGLLVLPFALFMVPVEHSSRQQDRVDFLYGLMVSMLASILALGALLNTFHTGTTYVLALFQSVVGIAAFLFAISWLWAPLAGFSGLGQLWERYLLNIGTPFEQWLANLADSAESRVTPEQFLESAMEQLVALPWVAGAEWRGTEEEGSAGQRTRHSFLIHVGEIEYTVYAERAVKPALLLHGKLLIQLVGDFHSAKQRELELAQSAHLQAIYETGARVTHDIKNLLQSLHTMTVALKRSDDDGDAQRLLQRQLPHLSQRLQLSLDKLQAPAEISNTTECELSDWWSMLKQRKLSENIHFQAEVRDNPLIPVDLFDSVVENLLENARVKRQSEPELEIEVNLSAVDGELRVQVCDNGSPIDEAVAGGLLKGPVKSRNGLGIGLFQAARQAEQLGYELSVDGSAPGHVCFELVRTDSTKRSPHPFRRRSDRAGQFAHLLDSGDSGEGGPKS